MEFMQVFIMVLNMGIIASYCIVAVILIRFLLRRQPKIFSYLLWSVVLFRLLCPVSVSSPYSLLRIDTNLFSRENITVWSETETRELQESFGGGAMERVQTPADAAEGGAKEAADPVAADKDPLKTGQIGFLFQAGMWIWLAGMFLSVLCGIRAAARFRSFLKKAVPLPTDGSGKTYESVYEIEGIPTPFVSGVVKPRIYLPAGLGERERGYVLEHERVHIARKDPLVKFIAWAARCVHWFNPLVWLAFAMMENDMEMSCDEAVLGRLGTQVRQEYSLALLSLSCEKTGTGGSPLAFGEGKVKNRILNILTYQKKALLSVLAVVILLAAVILGLSTNPTFVSEQKKSEEMLAFATAYANYFVGRDGNGLAGLYIDEETAYENVPLLEEENGVYTFGYSSPWPDEFRMTVDEEAQKVSLRYYACSSDPHVTVWKEEMTFAGTPDGYRVTGSQIKVFDSISTAEEFEEAYQIFDEYQFADYVERGYVDAINWQTINDREAGMEQDRNAVYRSPRTAAEAILNLTGGQSSANGGSGAKDAGGSDGQAVVKYVFADGSYVDIPMYNANYTGRTGNTFYTADAYASTGDDDNVGDVWIVDTRVWSEKAP